TAGFCIAFPLSDYSVRFKSLPTSGALWINSTNSPAVINTVYSRTDISVKGHSSAGTSSFDWEAVHVSTTASTCKFTLTMNLSCYSSCMYCDVTGDDDNHNCLSCKTDYYNLVDNDENLLV